ncbi:hypothetical protein [Pelagibacterium lentulum]|uniref:Uncharacterized protein n=1 Tax=Pelagibacterium lentulum TaxID=2029865 RepID=A0A916W4Q7_9HYPH|nr:hypothetical protein [Pelagibacterium lentulum]GGA65744.1 hypothetical protein GCM10011499_40130 [Pelagibacterium lentulum]
MTHIQVTPEIALREAMIENQFLKNRTLILAQQCADKDQRIAALEAQAQEQEQSAPPEGD